MPHTRFFACFSVGTFPLPVYWYAFVVLIFLSVPISVFSLSVNLPSTHTFASATPQVWAIGTGLTATPADAQGVHKYVRSLLAAKYGDTVADGVRIQYGTSRVTMMSQYPPYDVAVPPILGGTPLSFARILCLVLVGVTFWGWGSGLELRSPTLVSCIDE